MVSRILALIVWAAVAASVAFWGLRWFAKPAPVPPGTSPVALNTTPRGDPGKLLIGPEEVAAGVPVPTQSAALAARLQLVGVVAPRQGNATGVALLVVDGKPARAFKAGHTIDTDLVVQTISQQGVQIGPPGGAPLVSLDLPLLPPAATGTLPPAGSMSSAGGYPQAPGDPGLPPPQAYENLPPPAAGMAGTPVEGAEPPPPAVAPGATAQPSVPGQPRTVPFRRRRVPPSGANGNPEGTAPPEAGEVESPGV